MEIVNEASKSVVMMVLARATEEIRLSCYFKDDLNKLVKRLEIISRIILANSSVPDPAETSVDIAQRWLLGVEDILYDAENMLDVLAFEKVRRKLVRKLTFSKKLHFLFSSSNPVLYQWKMGRWVQRINTAIREAYDEAHTLGLRPADLPSHAADNQNALRQIRDIPDTSFVIGRNEDKAKLVDELLKPCTHNLSVVAIVGLGGLGKTVLAQQVYEDEHVKSHFNERISITVSRDFTILKILKDMVEFIKKPMHGCHSVEVILQTLSEHLSGERYLLVLDDVWNTHQGTWDSLHSTLVRIRGSTDSKILVTARDGAVAETMHTSLVHLLPELSPDNSWSLFKQIAFANRTLEHAAVLKIGKRIVKKCGGVPLAIKTIAGVLSNKNRAHEWDSIEKSYLWELDNAGILPSLMLSYTYLSSPLKKCFSLLAAFHVKGDKWNKDYLIRLWIANGFLYEPISNKKTMEDIGEEHFTKFLRISFLQEDTRNHLGEVSYFIMHDLVHDLAIYVGKHECLCLDLNGGHIQEHNFENVKYLRLTGQGSELADALVLPKLRSLQIFNNIPKGILLHAKYLRSLDLVALNLEEVPKPIARMKCLKFLNLSRNPIKVLPDWIMTLYNLQTLWLFECPYLFRIPEGLGNLVNLRHIEVNRFLQLPSGVEQLSSVQTLPPLWVLDGGFQIAELRNLHHVSGQLLIGGLELIKSKQDAEMANLSDKSRVERLSLHWTPYNREDRSMDLDEKVLDGLNPNSNLRLLYLEGYGSKKFPAWVKKMDVSRDVNSQSELRNLIKIKLDDCNRCEKLPTMGHLPRLKILEISGMKSIKRIGRELYGCDLSSSKKPLLECFPRLEELRLNNLDNLEEWCELDPPMVCFPRLELLEINMCDYLRKCPSKFPRLKNFTAKGIISDRPVSNIISNNTTLHDLDIQEVVLLDNLPEELSQCASLQTLNISNCPELISLPDVSGLTSLREVSITCNLSLRSPPSGLKGCTSLETLKFYNCDKSKAITEDLSGLGRLSELYISQPPDWLSNGLPRLRLLSIGRYLELDHFPDMSPLLKITSLVQLYLLGWRKLQSQTLPDQLQRFTRLTQLMIDAFDELEELPEWLGNLSSLEGLGLYRCPQLGRLPSIDAMKRLTKLVRMDISECPQLEDNVMVNGSEHHKVAHIQLRCPTIYQLA